MRIVTTATAAAASLALSACQVSKDEQNGTTTVELNGAVAENAAEDAAATAQNVAGDAANEAQEIGAKVSNEVGDVDVDVDVSRNGDANAQ